MRVAVAGNPNVGKTSLFNVLTGSRHQVGNYAGVTVERREGWVTDKLAGAHSIRLLDLPGTYSLSAISEDEAVAFRVIAGDGTPAPDVVLLVVDATNLARNLYLALQLRELGVRDGRRAEHDGRRTERTGCRSMRRGCSDCSACR